MGQDAEGDLIKRCQRGDPAAWDQLFDLHYAAAARFVFQLSQDLTREDTEEICQEVFLSVIRSIGSFTGRSRFQTWLFRIAANKTRDYRDRLAALKRGGGRASISLQAEDPETGLVLDPPTNGPGPIQALEQAEQSRLIHQALDKLDAPCREVIELRYFGELSYEEIAESLLLNPKTVSSRLSKCLDRLEQVARRVFEGAKTEFFPSNP